MSSSDAGPLVDRTAGLLAVATAVGGWLVGTTAPDSSPLGTAGYAVGGVALVSFVLVAFWRSYRRNVPTDRDWNQSAGRDADVGRPAQEADDHAGRSTADDRTDRSPSDDRPARTMYSGLAGYPMAVLKMIPLWILIAAFPFVYGWDGVATVPGVGPVQTPWFAFPAAALVGFGLNYWVVEHVFEYA